MDASFYPCLRLTPRMFFVARARCEPQSALKNIFAVVLSLFLTGHGVLTWYLIGQIPDCPNLERYRRVLAPRNERCQETLKIHTSQPKIAASASRMTCLPQSGPGCLSI